MEAFWKLKLKLYGDDAAVVDETEAICRAETAEQAVEQVSCMTERGWVVVGVSEGSHTRLLGPMAASGKQVSTKRWELYSLEMARKRREGGRGDSKKGEKTEGSEGPIRQPTTPPRSSARKDRVSIKVHLSGETEANLVERVEAESNKSGFVKRLISEEIEREKNGGALPYSDVLWPWFSSRRRRNR